MRHNFLLVAIVCCCLAPVTVNGQISTGFAVGDGAGAGFQTGVSNSVTLNDASVSGFDAIFSGGQQQQSFDGQSYNAGPNAYLVINSGATTFNGVSGSSDTATIDFTGPGAGSVSFFGANRGNGAAVSGTVFGLDDTTQIGSFSITQTSNQAFTNPTLTSFNEGSFGLGALGQAIGSIQFDLPGPNANAPYALAIDTFSATASTAVGVPEPSSAVALALLGMGLGFRRRRS